MAHKSSPVQFVISGGGGAPDTWVRDVSSVYGISVVQIWGETKPETLLVEAKDARAERDLAQLLPKIDPRLQMTASGTSPPALD